MWPPPAIAGQASSCAGVGDAERALEPLPRARRERGERIHPPSLALAGRPGSTACRTHPAREASLWIWAVSSAVCTTWWSSAAAPQGACSRRGCRRMPPYGVPDRGRTRLRPRRPAAGRTTCLTRAGSRSRTTGAPAGRMTARSAPACWAAARRTTRAWRSWGRPPTTTNGGTPGGGTRRHMLPARAMLGVAGQHRRTRSVPHRVPRGGGTRPYVLDNPDDPRSRSGGRRCRQTSSRGPAGRGVRLPRSRPVAAEPERGRRGSGRPGDVGRPGDGASRQRASGSTPAGSCSRRAPT